MSPRISEGNGCRKMFYTVCEVILSLFFVYGLYCSIWQIKRLIFRVRRGRDKIDKSGE